MTVCGSLTSCTTTVTVVVVVFCWAYAYNTFRTIRHSLARKPSLPIAFAHDLFGWNKIRIDDWN